MGSRSDVTITWPDDLVLQTMLQTQHIFCMLSTMRDQRETARHFLANLCRLGYMFFCCRTETATYVCQTFDRNVCSNLLDCGSPGLVHTVPGAGWGRGLDKGMLLQQLIWHPIG